MRLAVAAAFPAPELADQVIIPVVDDDFSASSLGDLPDDIRALARQLFVPIDWEQMAGGASSLMKCIQGVRADKISPVLEAYLRTVIKQTETFPDPCTETFPDPCTQEKIHTETQCVPLKLLTVSQLEESRKHSDIQIDEADRLLMRRRLGLGGTVGYGDSHLAERQQDVREADVHFAEAREDEGMDEAAMMIASVIVGPAACGKTTLLNRTTCGYAKDALRGCPGAVVPYVIRVMAFARWLINSPDALLNDDVELVMEYILQSKDHCNGRKKGLYEELLALFEAGELALIFDGIDEAGVKLEEISNYIGKSLGSNYTGRMIISSRESLFDESLFNAIRFQLLQIQPLTEAMQDDVLRRRFTTAADVHDFKEQQSTSENLKEMGTNPLLLALQIGVFLLDDKQLPELRTDLYEKGVRVLLRRAEVNLTGARNVKTVAAAVKPSPNKLPTKMDARMDDLLAVLCQMGYFLHIQQKTRQFVAGHVLQMLQDEATDLAGLSRDAAIAAWQDLLQDGRGIIMCVEQDPDGDGESMNDVYRSTHLTLQEYFAARQCVTNARRSGDPNDMLAYFEQVFGLDPSPWLREVMLMVAEMLTPDEFKLLADYYLNNDDDSGAASVRVTTMMTCRREDTTTGVGAHIQQRLAATRSAELMAEALCHPSDALRTQGLTEITEFGMSKDTVVEKLLAMVSAERSAHAPWYLRIGGTQSLGKLQVCSEDVLLKLSSFASTTTGAPMWKEEAMRALQTLNMESSQSVNATLVIILVKGPAEDRQRAWQVIKWLEVTNDAVLDKLAEFMAESSEVTDYLALLRAPEPDLEPDTSVDPERDLAVVELAADDQDTSVPEDEDLQDLWSSQRPSEMREFEPEPEPEPEPELEPDTDGDDDVPAMLAKLTADGCRRRPAGPCVF